MLFGCRHHRKCEQKGRTKHKLKALPWDDDITAWPMCPMAFKENLKMCYNTYSICNGMWVTPLQIQAKHNKNLWL